MNTLIRHRRSALAVLLSTALLASAGTARAGGFVFVKNAKNGTAKVGRDDVKELYTGKRRSWADGSRVELVLNPAGSAELKWIAEDVIGASEDIVLSRIKEEVFKGDMKKPPTVSSAADCFAEIKKAAGAICVVDDAAAKSLPDGVALLPYSK